MTTVSKPRYSASQLETVDLCRRKWYFNSYMRLDRGSSDSLAFGNIFHNLAERYLKDQPLYPDGWAIDKENNYIASIAEQSLIKSLVTSGIEQGILERRAGGETENKFKIEFDTFVYVGKIDYAVTGRIEDHKTVKKVKYALSSKKLKESIQMMSYGYVHLTELQRKGILPPRVVTLVHNQFIKIPPEVRRREAEVTPTEIATFWKEKILPAVAKCDETAKVKDPFAIPEPGLDACAAYGGCPFLSICNKEESITAYQKRLSETLKTQPSPHQTMTSTPPPMSPADFLASRGVAKPSINPPPPADRRAPAPATTSNAAPSQAPGTSAASTPPPWFWTDCLLCKHATNKGFSKQTKKLCRICLTNGPMKGVSQAQVEAEFFHTIADDGTIYWNNKNSTPIATIPAEPVAATGTKAAYVTVEDAIDDLRNNPTKEHAQEVMLRAQAAFGESEELSMVAAIAEELLAETPEPIAAAAAAPLPTPVAVQQPTANLPPVVKKALETEPVQLVPVPVEDKPTKKASKKVNTDTILVIGASMVRWPGKEVIFAEQILNEIPGYWQEQNVFARRDTLRRDPKVLEGYYGKVIVQLVANPDIDNLMSILVTRADAVIVGTR